MKPLTVLIGIVMGSAVSLAVGLLLTWVVFLFMPEYSDRIAAEREPLLKAVALFSLLAAAAVGSFYGEVRGRSWRLAAHMAMLAMLGLAAWVYWPR
jgi:hypothetical protein